MTSDRHALSRGLDRCATRAAVGDCCVGLSRCPLVQAGQGCIRSIQLWNVGPPVDDQASRGRTGSAFRWSGIRDGRLRRRTARDRRHETAVRRPVAPVTWSSTTILSGLAHSFSLAQRHRATTGVNARRLERPPAFVAPHQRPFPTHHEPPSNAYPHLPVSRS